MLIPSSVRLASGYTALLSLSDAASRRHKSIGYDSVSALAKAGYRSSELEASDSGQNPPIYAKQTNTTHFADSPGPRITNVTLAAVIVPLEGIHDPAAPA